MSNVSGLKYTRKQCLLVCPPAGNMAVSRPIMGGGGVYAYIHVLPDGFLLKAIVFTVCEHEYTTIHPLLPIIASSYGPAWLGNNVSCFAQSFTPVWK